MTIFSITLFGIHIAPSWYGLMYALGFFIGYWILKRRKILSDVELESLIFYVFIGVLIGGRLGYVLFYNLPFYLANPLEIIQTWHGGMSFHGGVIGVIIAMILFSQINRKPFLIIADHITSVLPIGLGLGRIGNYLNGELLGFANYTGPLAVIKNGVSYFPSPLLEATLEGVVLFMILFFLRQKNIFPGKIAASFLFWYGIFRFSVEFVRIPDVGLGYLTFGLTMGQILSIPMIIIGTILYFFFKKNAK
ncbi:prolipoprotein diacylglyceryl transferase [Candidatus Gracilibacteria bacterium]|nr:prolipoprotein diacylglyceryl transferase [Candidatus Gracilibacteria bacterium]OIO76569.1 MAG: prolipoprotein diacylglyceryl transferase [Candidatus Gracilibacteria bacterium CG1_02_38_174]PIQ42196.1 MAG: prolipoprotein diacylglyceryl transferase [Candidatus Gracilibacteria bacterium CG12_big_fil_rev_8_21_14_0_65_38_15]PIZ01579.1 MAG: prolipoprotein diacylglyceryl transferase [Candidatus Gracilibacteria bacterium CG_4_10_14_0_8_um_filter_38_28]